MYEHVELIDEPKEVHIKYTAIEPASQPRKWIPLVFICVGVLCLMVACLLIGLHFSRSGFDPSCNNATAEKLLEAQNRELSEERERLKQTLQNIDNHTLDGWLYFGGSFYLGSTSGRSWEQSREFCQQRGADLIIINSTEEQEFARLTFLERRWIGLSEPHQAGVWKWVDGSPLTTSFWHPGEPSNYGNYEDCAEVNYYTDRLRNWNDDDCASKHKCICEKRIT